MVKNTPVEEKTKTVTSSLNKIKIKREELLTSIKDHETTTITLSKQLDATAISLHRLNGALALVDMLIEEDREIDKKPVIEKKSNKKKIQH